MVSSRTVLVCTIVCLALPSLGCSSLWHDLQPFRIQRLNRGDPPSLDPEFTSHFRSKSKRLAKTDRALIAPKLTANSADIATLRAQSPQGTPESVR